MSQESWVEVRDEPRHQRRFENEYARVYDVRVPPGDQTLYHRHTEDTLYVCIASTRIEDQTWGQPDAIAFDVPPDVALCRPHRDEPLIHRITNIGQQGMRMIGAEVKKSPDESSPTPLEHPLHALQWETPRLRAYRLDLEPGKSTGEVHYGFAGLTIALTEGNLASRDVPGINRMIASAAGDLAWHDGPVTFELSNCGDRPFSTYVVEWL